MLGLVGESGAGKSLTAAALIGLVAEPVRIVAGRLSVQGRAVSLEDSRAVQPLRGKLVGFVPQDPFTSLDPLFRVGDQLVETLRAHLPLDGAAARERAIGLLGDVGLPSPAERFAHYPHQLSGGMRQRVAIALALAAGPPLVVADECTTALDVSTQAQIVALLARLVEEHGVSVLLITHDLGVVAELATEVAIMYAGRIVERAPVGRLVREPRHPYTRALLDAVPKIGGNGGGSLPAIPGAMPRPGELPPDARSTRGARGRRTAAGASDRRWSRPETASSPAGIRSEAAVAESATPFLELRGMSKRFEIPRPLLSRVVSRAAAGGGARGGGRQPHRPRRRDAREWWASPDAGRRRSGGSWWASRCRARGSSGSAASRSRAEPAGARARCSGESRWCSRTRTRRSTHGGGCRRSSPSRRRASCPRLPAGSAAASSSGRWGSRRRIWTSTRISSRAGSGSGWRSPGRCAPSRSWWSVTSRPRRSTCRCRRRC